MLTFLITLLGRRSGNGGSFLQSEFCARARFFEAGRKPGPPASADNLACRLQPAAAVVIRGGRLKPAVRCLPVIVPLVLVRGAAWAWKQIFQLLLELVGDVPGGDRHDEVLAGRREV